jgi:cytidylate kinase
MHPIITISGSPGSGKSTVAKLLVEHFGFSRLNAGALFREMAEKQGLTVEHMVHKAKENPKINLDFDELILSTAEAMAKKTPVIFESRLAGWLTKKAGVSAFRVWVEATAKTRALRVSERERIAEEVALKLVKARESEEIASYKETQGIDLRDEGIYDMVVRTDRLRPVEVRNRIIKGFQSYVRRNQAGNDR